MHNDPPPNKNPKRDASYARGRLTARDVRILHLLGAVGVATTDQVARGCGFPSRERALRRVNFLRRLGLVEQSAALGSNAPALVTLTKRGARSIADSFPLTSEVRVPARALALVTLAHELALGTETYLYIDSLVAKTSGLAMCGWHEGRQLATRGSAWARCGLAADIVGELEQDTAAFSLAIELDTGSEGSRQLRSKLTRYVCVFEQGLVDELWIVVPTEQRRASVVTLVESLPIAASTRVLCLVALSGSPVPDPPPRVSTLAIRQSKTQYDETNKIRHNG
jgi:hypothetical protein